MDGNGVKNNACCNAGGNRSSGNKWPLARYSNAKRMKMSVEISRNQNASIAIVYEMKNCSSAVSTQRDQERHEGRSGDRRDKIAAEGENKRRQRQAGHRHEGNAPGQKQAQAIPQIINRLEQELADIAFPDIRGNLPVVFIHRRQHVHHRHHEIIENHLRRGVSGNRRPALLLINGEPERQHGEQRNEAEQRARQIIDAIRQVALDADADDVPILFHFPVPVGNLAAFAEFANGNFPHRACGRRTRMPMSAPMNIVLYPPFHGVDMPSVHFGICRRP